MDLVEFLRARLARDEQIARDCASAPWKAAPSGTVGIDTDEPAPTAEPAAKAEFAAKTEFTAKADFVAKAENDAYAEHIARHDPARTLAEVAARRRIVDDYEKNAWILGQGHSTPELEAAQAVRESVLRLLALPYATHPAYQEEWRP
ncbi:hypothetical protein SAMN05443665_102959 [Actinomadura meyerae]|uniref:Uncharacterized protein n=1 Tax=Actinomadura meyerae TaxID=240840 RepID=A0A239MN44_9ACTN|nr:DUF6221 family protein [Actinomadura meyerae]SNT43269.1 hypothetical protein SAMN05443665_102959 [Actinomadura meyerae]